MRLKELRKNKGVSQEQVAHDLGLSLRGYQNYEYGQREPNIETILKLAEYYNVTVDYLLEKETIQPLDQFENLKFTKEMEKKANEDYQKLSPQDKAFIARMVKALVDSHKEHEKQDKKNVP
ncbi:MAG: helix-turn-helix domain-containing protein [Oscillospiraceae bacterium]|nr:helix-turn-helix domain-containing protein [Oscillospiraceae bacterium]